MSKVAFLIVTYTLSQGTYLILVKNGWERSKAPTTPNTGKEVEQQKPLISAGGKEKWNSSFGRPFGGFLQN